MVQISTLWNVLQINKTKSKTAKMYCPVFRVQLWKRVQLCSENRVIKWIFSFYGIMVLILLIRT